MITAKTARALVMSVSASMFVGGVAHASVPHGIYVAELYANSVVNVLGGGDFTNAPRFATGLAIPMGLCVGPNQDLYVAEFGAGTVKVITAGGDFANAAPFAWGLSGPTGLACTPGKIVVAEHGSGELTDITAGGDMTNAPAFAKGLGQPLALLRDSGVLWAATEFATNPGIFDVTAGGDYSLSVPYVQGTSGGLARHAGKLLVADSILDAIRVFDGGGTIFSLPAFASHVDGAIALAETSMGLFVSSNVSGTVIATSAGGDLANATPYATGIDKSAGAILAVLDCGDGVLDPGEQCDDAGETATCDSDCTFAACGDGTVNVTAGEECDDGNVASGDGCSASCKNETTGAGGAGGASTASSGSATTGGGAGASTAASTGATDGSVTGPASTGVAAGAGGSEASGATDDSGCGCRTTPRRESTFAGVCAALIALAAARRRRRPT